MKYFVRSLCAAIVVVLLIFLFIHFKSDAPVDSNVENKEPLPTVKHKVLYVNSYHTGYEWSDSIENAILSVFHINRDEFGALDHSRSAIDLRIYRMDSKRNKSIESMIGAGLEVKSILEQWKPDLVIASDDNAVKYIVKPYLNATKTPVVLCGVNWNLDHYDLTVDQNVTGMVEVTNNDDLMKTLMPYAKGNRIGFLAGDTVSANIEFMELQKVPGIVAKQYLVNHFSDWIETIKTIQSDVDMVMISNYPGIKGWDSRRAKNIMEKEVSIPSGTTSNWMSEYNLITYGRSSEEQGTWAATTALKVLKGTPPHQIPIASNVQTKICLNMKIAKTLGVKFPLELIRVSHLISAGKKKVLYIDSYHQGYLWSDDIEKGLLKALSITKNSDGSYNTSKSNVLLKTFRMDTKRNSSESFKEQAGIMAKTIIENWQPDVVVTSDDNAAKYLIHKYYLHSTVPFVFCGVNHDASDYGFPAVNITGMLEIAPYSETIKMLRKFSKGDRLGVIGADVFTGVKQAEYLSSIYQINEEHIGLTRTYDEWKKKYRELQNSVDMILWLSPIGIKNWDQENAQKFILNYTKIPTCAVSDNNVSYALLGHVKIGEEQGWWAGNTASKILSGISPSEVPIATNKQVKLYLNLKLANRLNIKFPVEMIEKATLISQ